MCDYSLMAIPNRLAVCGEELVSHRFGTGAKGFISSVDARKLVEPTISPKDWFARIWLVLRNQQCTAVCIPPGAHLLMRDLPARLQNECGVQGQTQEVVFTQTSMDSRFRDAVRFANGVELSLQKFCEGVRVKVLSLSSDETRPPLITEEIPSPDLLDVFGALGGR